MMAQTLTTADTYQIVVCCDCSIPFAITTDLYQRRQCDGASFCCPNGHRQHFAETDTTRLRRAEREREAAERQRDSAQARERHADDQRQAAENSNRTLRGHLTRARKRAAAGVCPCCTRQFSNVAQHMRTKHPGYVESTKDGA